jgi:hypothetical protein
MRPGRGFSSEASTRRVQRTGAPSGLVIGLQHQLRAAEEQIGEGGVVALEADAEPEDFT